MSGSNRPPNPYDFLRAQYGSSPGNFTQNTGTTQDDYLSQMLNTYQQQSQQNLQTINQMLQASQLSSEKEMQHLLQIMNQPQSLFSTQTSPQYSLNPYSTPAAQIHPTPVSSSAPPPPPGPHISPPPPPRNTLLPQQVLNLIPTRASSARARLGPTAVLEARKGLSRQLDATSIQDIHLFGQQLRRTDRSAVEPNWQHEDRLPIFAVSYVQRNPADGRFKFDDHQWQCFVDLVKQLAECGVSKFRVWLDQCLWLRDASQGGWAHTGLLPYIMWPVLSLGIKKVGGEKSVETEKRMWPFLEEVSGLWGMGVIFAREMRSNDCKAGWRKWMSYCHRLRIEPERGMELLLLNVFHGAVDNLHTGWQDDVTELKDMARANVLMNGSELYVGSDWKQRLAGSHVSPKNVHQAIEGITLSVKTRYFGGENLFLDGSRTVISGSWNGIREWLSGQDGVAVGDPYMFMLGTMTYGMTKVQVISNIGEFELLKIGDLSSALWMVVAMNGPTSNFSRGKVAWTKIMTGLGSSQLGEGNLNSQVVEQVLGAELQRRIQVMSVTLRTNPIEWE